MLNKAKTTLLAATVLTLCARHSMAQYWNDEEVKIEQTCDSESEWFSWESVPDLKKTGEGLAGWTARGGVLLRSGPKLEGGLALPMTSAAKDSECALPQ